MMEYAVGERLEVEADPPHRARHQIAAEVDAVAAGDDHPQLYRNDVETLGDILADPDTLMRTASARRRVRLRHDLDPRQRRRQRFARARRALRTFGLGGFEVRPNGGEPGLDLLEGKGVLIQVERFAASAVAGSLKRFLERNRSIRGAPSAVGLAVENFIVQCTSVSFWAALDGFSGQISCAERASLMAAFSPSVSRWRCALTRAVSVGMGSRRTGRNRPRV